VRLSLIIVGLAIASVGAAKRPGKSESPPRKKSAELRCREAVPWTALASSPDFTSDPANLGNGWEPTAHTLAHRYRCSIGDREVPDVESTAIVEGPDLGATSRSDSDSLGGALEKAGDPCVRERIAVLRSLSHVLSGPPYLGALWRCERAAGKNQDRECAWARALQSDAWNWVSRMCGASCTPDMDAVDACRFAFGTTLKDRDACVNRYALAQQAVRRECARFACEEAKSAEADFADRTKRACEERTEACWRRMKRHQQEWDECAADPGPGNASCKVALLKDPRHPDEKTYVSDNRGRNYITDDCKGYDKPCTGEQGADVCRRSVDPASNPQSRSAIHTCEIQQRKLSDQVAKSCVGARPN
jgi:hypothetical protein